MALLAMCIATCKGKSATSNVLKTLTKVTTGYNKASLETTSPSG
jgi:hypothetical protein